MQINVDIKVTAFCGISWVRCSRSSFLSARNVEPDWKPKSWAAFLCALFYYNSFPIGFSQQTPGKALVPSDSLPNWMFGEGPFTGLVLPPALDLVIFSRGWSSPSMLEERLTGNLCSPSQVVKAVPLCWFLCCIYPRPKPISVQYLQPHQKRRAFTAPRQNRRKLTFSLRKCLANPFSSGSRSTGWLQC